MPTVEILAAMDFPKRLVTLRKAKGLTQQTLADANLALKEEILGKTRPIQSRPGRYRPWDRLLNFLKGL